MKRITAILFRNGSEKAYVLAGQAVFSATSFITTLLLARLLGIEAFGQYSSIVLFSYLLLSIGNALVVAPFQVLAAKQQHRETYIAALFMWQLLLTTLFCVVTALLLNTQTTFTRNINANTVAIICLLAGFLLHDFFRRIFLAVQKAKQALVIDLVSGGLQITALAVSAYNKHLNLETALYIIALTYLPALALAVYYSGKLFTGFRKWLYYGRLNWATGKWLLFTATLQWWANNFLVAASGIFLGVQALGALRLAQTLFGIINALLQVFENHALPAASALLAQSPAHMSTYLQGLTRRGLLLLMPVTLACFLFPQQLFVLFGGAAYATYAGVLQGMALLYIVIVMGYPVRIVIRAMLMNRDFFTAYIISFLFSATAATMLIRQWQLWGVITALLINQLLMLAYWHWALYKRKFNLWKLYM